MEVPIANEQRFMTQEKLMAEKEFSCKNCGAPLSNYAKADVVRCKYCGTAFGDGDAGVEVLNDENPSHEFNPPPKPPEIQFTDFQKRTVKSATDWLVGRIVSRVAGACLPYLILGILLVVGVLALLIWGIVALFAG